MKRINEYKKIFDIEGSLELKELKTAYRNFMKEWHPDKFSDNDEKKKEAEEKSKQIIEAYHFLVSIAPETQDLNLAEYTTTINAASIVDINFKSQTLQISFDDGNSYEYFGVPKSIYIKLVNADSQGRFARRHICTSYTYRNISKLVSVA